MARKEANKHKQKIKKSDEPVHIDPIKAELRAKIEAEEAKCIMSEEEYLEQKDFFERSLKAKVECAAACVFQSYKEEKFTNDGH
jgi:L-fucose mutarotase/ribose pyranase (RbsD/FucU family)